MWRRKLERSDDLRAALIHHAAHSFYRTRASHRPIVPPPPASRSADRPSGSSGFCPLEAGFLPSGGFGIGHVNGTSSPSVPHGSCAELAQGKRLSNWSLHGFTYCTSADISPACKVPATGSAWSSNRSGDTRGGGLEIKFVSSDPPDTESFYPLPASAYRHRIGTAGWDSRFTHQ